MISYLARRIGISLIVLAGVSLLVYGLLHVVFPSPARAVLGLRVSQTAVNAWNKQNGYDDPLIVQYLHWANQVLHGNFGWSYANNQSVLSLFKERAARSVYLSAMALIFSLLIAFPLGIFQAVKRHTVGDNVVTSIAFVMYSMPVFLLGLILIQVFSLSLHVFGFEASQSNSIWAVMGDWHDMTLPVLTLTAISFAAYSRYMRSSSMDVLAQDYIKVARAKGLSERLVLSRHLVRNASLPMITLVGLSLPLLMAGNLVTEYVFNYPGLGMLFFESLGKSDYPTMLAYTLILAVLVIVGNLLADIALGIADPRIRMA